MLPQPNLVTAVLRKGLNIIRILFCIFNRTLMFKVMIEHFDQTAKNYSFLTLQTIQVLRLLNQFVLIAEQNTVLNLCFLMAKQNTVFDRYF